MVSRTSTVKTYSIDNDTNNITVHATKQTAQEAQEAGSALFSSQADLAGLLTPAKCTNERLLEIWNSLPGVTPVKKFTSRSTAAERIWKAVQSLGADIVEDQEGTIAEEAPAENKPEAPAEENEDVKKTTTKAKAKTAKDDSHSLHGIIASKKAATKKKATSKKNDHVNAQEGTAPREGSKTAQVIAMLKRKGGATLEELCTAMGWQQHTTRALMSAGGSLAKKHGITVVSESVKDVRTYFIKG